MTITDIKLAAVPRTMDELLATPFEIEDDAEVRLAAANRLIAELNQTQAALFGALKAMVEMHGGLCVSPVAKQARAALDLVTRGAS